MAKRRYVIDGGTYGPREDVAPDETEDGPRIPLDEAFARLEDMLVRMEAGYAQLQDALLQQTATLQSLQPVRDSKGRGKEPKTIMAMNARDAFRAVGVPEADIQKAIQLMLKAGNDSLDLAQKARANEAARKAAQRVMRQDGQKSGPKAGQKAP